MIVWFNCKISDIRLNPQPRFNLRNDNRFDIARYSFASFVPLMPLVTKFIFNLEMADGHAGQEAEMEQWLYSLFPSEKLAIYWHRCNNIAQWREKQQEIYDLNDPLVFPAGNEDHIFLDSNIDIFKEGLEILSTSDVNTVLGISHYPEAIRACYTHTGQLISPNYSYLSMPNNDAVRVMHLGLFDWYLDQVRDPNSLIFRTENWNGIAIPRNIVLLATKEQFRHFDGYGHVHIGGDVCPPLEIPPHFFSKDMVIKYGFDQRDANCVNINPTSKTLYAVDPIMGTDYKMTLEDLPAFWKPFIKEIVVNDPIDHNAMALARNQYYVDLTQIDINWHHVGQLFDKSNVPPIEWIQPHLLETH